SQVRRPDARFGPPRRDGRPEVRRAHPHRVPAARAADAEPAPRAATHADLRPGMGLRLRADLERPACVCRLPAPQARGGRRAGPDPHGEGGRLRAAGAAGMSLRTRMVLVAGVAVAIAVIAVAAASYAGT